MIYEKKINIEFPRLDLMDGFTYSHVKAPLQNKEMDLPMMVMYESPIGKPPWFPPAKRPTILWVMGGAWLACPRAKVFPSLLTYFGNHGYTVAAAEYRVTSEATWPAQIEDVLTAIRYLRANADKLGVDPDRIAVMGLSAGGHLTAMAAMNPEEYTTDEWKEFSSTVTCAVDMFGPTEIATVKEGAAKPAVAMPPMPGPEPEERLIGAPLGEKPELWADANPINHISDKTAPLLILHGDNDAVVSMQQSVKLHDALNAAGHPTDMYILNGAGHGAAEFFQEETKEIILNFLDKYMK